MNIVNLIGRFTADPDGRTTSSGTACATFTLAVDKGYTGKDGQRGADFIDCVAWRNTAEFITKYFGKGKLAAITGRIETRTYEGKDGQKRKAVEVNVDKIEFCGTKKDAAEPTSLDPEPYEDDADLPF